ncbi:MAG: hypothetical protein GY801_19060 [bacterium]|nr:hypothetical protein [bacterium]
MNTSEHTVKLREIFTEALSELRQWFPQYIGYKIAFFLLALLVFSPFSALMFSLLTQSSSYTVLTNEYVASYLFSLRGALTLFSWGVFTFFLIFIEQAGIIFICSYGQVQRRPPLFATLKFLFQKLSALLKLGAALFLRFLLFSLPFLFVWGLTYFLLLSEYDINYYLTQKPPAFWLALAIGGVNLIAYLILLLGYVTRWIFVLHLLLLKQTPLAEAFQTSQKLVAGIGLTIFRMLILWALGTWLFINATTASIAFSNRVILETLAVGPKLAVLVMGLLYVYDFMITTFFISLGVPVLSIMLTKFYQQRLDVKGLTTSAPGSAKDYGEGVFRFFRWQRKMLWLALGLLLVCIIMLGGGLVENFTQPDKVAVTAHRGSSKKAPENSLSAVRQAIEDGADYAEIDVQETADGVIVVVHDADLMRVTGRPLPLWKTLYEELKDLDAGSWFSPEFAGEKIPTLKEMIELARGKIKLNIELKFNGNADRLTERVVEIVQEENFVDRCVISSLNYEAVLRAKELDEELQVGYIIFGAIGKSSRIQSDFLSVSKDIISESMIAKVHANDREVHIWTYSDAPNALDRFIYLGVDNIITDYPAELVQTLKRRAEMDDFERVKENFLKWLQR